MNEARYTELIAAHLSGNISEKDQEALFAWVAASEQNQLLFEDLSEGWEMAADYQPSFPINEESSWQALQSKLSALDNGFVEPEEFASGGRPPINLDSNHSASSSGKVIQGSFLQPWMKVAASMLLVAGLAAGWFLSQSGEDTALAEMVEVTTEQGKLKQLTLPDGSKVWLNGNSSLKYSDEFAVRDVMLKGEAIFEVVKNAEKPFTVNSGDTRTRVLGTKFNVRAYPDEPEVVVTVESGKVEVAEQQGQKVLLTKGMAANYNRKGKALKKTDIASKNATSWQTKKLRFDNSSMLEVIESIEKHFKIDIGTPNERIQKCHFTGTFENPKFKELIEVIEFGLNVQISKAGKQYKIEGEGC